MKAPKHIRDARKQALKAAEQDFRENGAPKSNSMVSGTGTKGNTVNMGFRSSNHSVGLRASIHFTPLGGSSNGLLRKDRQRASDVALERELKEAYIKGTGGDKPATKHGACSKIKVRVGTTPPRTLKIVDPLTGQPKVIRLKSAPRWAEVGLPDSIPKDGGLMTVSKDGNKVIRSIKIAG